MTGKEVFHFRQTFRLSMSDLADQLQVGLGVVRRLERTPGELPRRDQLMLRGLKAELIERQREVFDEAR